MDRTRSPDIYRGESISPTPSWYSPRSVSLFSSSGCDVVKRGILYVKRAPSKRAIRISIKTWQKKYVILRDDWKESGTTTLDIYDRECDAPGADGKSLGSIFFASRPYTVDLRFVTNVDQYLESRSFVHALIVNRSNGFPVILGAQSELEMKGWLAAVTVLADKASELVSRIHRPPSCPMNLVHEVKKPAKGTLSLANRLNRSTPQLFKVVSGGSLHHVVDRQMSSSGNLATTSDGSYLDVLYADSAQTPQTPLPSATLADYPSLKKIWPNSFFTNSGSHKESGSKWRPFSKMSRKDSGFSESFDESSSSSAGDQTQINYCPPEDTVHEEDHIPSSSPPPLPPRKHSSPFSTSPFTPCHEPWLFNAPPRPPPRPIHTLSHPCANF